MVPISGNSLVVKEVNIGLIRKALLSLTPATKQELSKATGLSIVTTATILNQLVAAGEVLEDSRIPSKGGRPARLYRYNMDFHLILVIYSYVKAGEDTFFFKVKNRSNQIIYQQETTIRNLSLHSFQPYIDELTARFPQISAAGFAMPGVEEGGLLTSHDYEMLQGVPFLKYYQDLYDFPILYENDVNAATVGFVSRYAIMEDTSCIYIYFPEKYPPGAGIYIKGGLYKGFRNMAGEIGRLPLGTDWLKVDYRSQDAFAAAACRLLVTVISVINPREIVLYGEFITPACFQEILRRCEGELSEPFQPKFYLSESFHQDYEDGITALTYAMLDLAPVIKEG